ncbi:S-adenosyl-L-methionine-dependent methyltransferase [Naematelia encephala]|uniref:type I protein arginine methyltransferase n=1 Tax=Naematelia encephala TaxID=71784 RepID=A0A1Y2BJP6_9TREE|nr:S-adenosyl-L-methionine-dependent methyltransferase [Naematelia encephala]
MSYQLKSSTSASAAYDDHSGSSSSSSESDDGVSDWASSLGDALRTKSLFDDSIHPSPEVSLAYDVDKWRYNLKEEVKRLEVDLYGVMKLVNLIRKNGLSVAEAKGIKKDDEALKGEEMLVPVIPDDPLLQLDFDDSWSDDELPTISNAAPQPVGIAGPGFSSVGGRGKGKGKLRDDDSHYFDSYAENDIHEIMLKDTVRTVSYGRYILSNPRIFRGAVVLDVGCGTGILSMFAARAGAKKVYAVEASGLATKTRENIKRNGLDGIIEVIQGKVEDVELPEKVDVIVSEWMGYMLLYESMLDSVLHARDRYLKPSGIMAPSQTRLVIAGITADRIWRERVDFWSNVYGFDMKPMDTPCYADGLVESVPAQEVITTESILRDIDTHTATPKSLDFTTSFSITSSASSGSSTTIRAFLTWFDTFFSTSREPVSPTEQVEITPIPEEAFTDAVQEPCQGEAARPVGFTTGPRGRETHWRQVAFLLRQPITLQQGEKIQGRFSCHKSAHNSRELDVEVHYAVIGAEVKSDKEITYTVQTYKVR